MYICLLLLPVTHFLCHFFPPCEVTECIVCISACVGSYFVYLFDHSSSLRNLNVTHEVSMISRTTILVKLLQIIWRYVNSFTCQSDFFSVSSLWISHHISIMQHMLHFRRETWSSSHYGELEKKLKSKGIFKGRPKDILTRGDLLRTPWKHTCHIFNIRLRGNVFRR